MVQHFKSLRHDVSAKEPWNGIQDALAATIIVTSQETYKSAALQVGKTPLISDLIILRKAGATRAEWVASEMRGWTEQSLVASKKSKLLSLARANKAAVYESRKAAFDGTVKGWLLNAKTKKEWYTSNEHSAEDICDDNEDDGIIDMDEAFSSGDTAPPAHLYCLCGLWLHM